jgi:hypothetical protein
MGELRLNIEQNAVFLRDMQDKVVETWTAALRSGRYKQGTMQLREILKHQQDKFCCLGVLADLAVQEEVPTCLKTELSKTDWDDGYFMGMIGALPSGWLDPATAEELMSLNDGGMSFEKIADVIENRHKEGLLFPQDMYDEEDGEGEE